MSNENNLNQDFNSFYAEQRKKELKLKSKVAWYNPKEDSIYLSNNDKVPQYWSENLVVPKVAMLNKGIKELKEYGDFKSEELGKVSFFASGYQAEAESFYKEVAKVAASGGVMTPQDFDGIEVTNVLAQLRGVEEPRRVLQNAASIIQTPFLEGRIDSWTGFDVISGIKIGEEIPTQQGTFSSLTFELGMIGSHISRFFELSMRPYYHDPWQNHLTNIGKRVIKKKAELVRDELFGGSNTVVGADWGAFSAGESTNKPGDHIETAATTIGNAGGEADSIAMKSQAFSDYVTNKFTKGAAYIDPAIAPQPGLSKVLGLPGTTYIAYVDNVITSNDAVLYEKNAIVFFQGPSQVATYEDVHHRLDGYYYWDYNLAKRVENSKIVRITGVTV